MKRPLIGITTNHLVYAADGKPYSELRDSYTLSVLNAGGLPVLLPAVIPPTAFAETLERLDGIVFSGGGDIHPDHFNGVNHEKVSGVDAERDTFELGLARAAIERGLPLLAICRGHQVLNVAQGGTLYTHIPDQVENALPHYVQKDWQRNILAHAVSLEPGCRLAQILGTDRPETNSLHHQGIERLGAGLRTVGVTTDGVIEAVEVVGHPFAIGVQWHPEGLQELESMRSLFKAFVAACSQANPNGTPPAAD